MTDRFKTRATGNTDPVSHGFPITPNDSAEISETTRAIYVGGAGSLSVTLAGGSDLTFVNVQSGTILPLRVVAVKATGTDAGNIIGLV